MVFTISSTEPGDITLGDRLFIWVVSFLAVTDVVYRKTRTVWDNNSRKRIRVPPFVFLNIRISKISQIPGYIPELFCSGFKWHNIGKSVRHAYFHVDAHFLVDSYFHVYSYFFVATNYFQKNKRNKKTQRCSRSEQICRGTPMPGVSQSVAKGPRKGFEIICRSYANPVFIYRLCPRFIVTGFIVTGFMVFRIHGFWIHGFWIHRYSYHCHYFFIQGHSWQRRYSLIAHISVPCPWDQHNVRLHYFVFIIRKPRLGKPAFLDT